MLVAGLYIFNLATKGLSASTWQLHILFGDGSFDSREQITGGDSGGPIIVESGELVGSVSNSHDAHDGENCTGTFLGHI